MSGFRRTHFRAPLKEQMLYGDGPYVHRANCLNISEGGLFLEGLPAIPGEASFPLIVALPTPPPFESLGKKKVLQLSREDLPLRTLRLRSRITRSFEGLSEVDKTLVTKVGLAFVDPPREHGQTIADYVEQSKRNVSYLLGLFEVASEDEERQELLDHTARLLDYPNTLKWPLLRAKILHDYHSLTTL